jgi:hypothetical protein
MSRSQTSGQVEATLEGVEQVEVCVVQIDAGVQAVFSHRQNVPPVVSREGREAVFLGPDVVPLVRGQVPNTETVSIQEGQGFVLQQLDTLGVESEAMSGMKWTYTSSAVVFMNYNFKFPNQIDLALPN